MQMPMPFGSGMTGNIGFNFPSANQAPQVPQNIQVFPQAPQNFYGGQASLGNQTSPSFKNPTNYQPSIQNAYQNSGYPAAPQMQTPYQQTPQTNNTYPIAQNQYQSPTANYPNYSPGQINPQSYQNQYANPSSFQQPANFGTNAYPNSNNSYNSSYPQTNTPRSSFGSNQKKEVV